MEANDSNSRGSISTDESTLKRHSNRIKKPRNLFKPKPVQIKPKKSALNVSCEVLKTKGVSIRTKQLDFSFQGNMQVHNVIQKYLKKIKFRTLGCTIVYFCEETQKWKKFKRSEKFALGNTYKIRAVKLKKQNKITRPNIIENKEIEPKREKKEVELKEIQNLNLKMNQNDALQYMMYLQNYVYQDYSMLMRMAWFQNFS